MGCALIHQLCAISCLFLFPENHLFPPPHRNFSTMEQNIRKSRRAILGINLALNKSL
jgi:hypothetical protein